MAKLSYAQLKGVVDAYVVANKIGNPDLTITKDNIVGLIDKIGKVVTLDTSYTDKLAFMDAEELGVGGYTIEEWQQDLVLPQDYDESGANVDAPNYPTYRPNFYSRTLGKKVLKTTIPFNNIERAVNNEGEFISVTSMITKRLFDSEASFKYGIKKQMIAELIARCTDAMGTSTSFNPTTNYQVGTYVYDILENSHKGVIVKPYTQDVSSGWNDAVAKGYIIELDLVTTIAKPTDTTSGEAFIKQLKSDVEVASDLNEGHSLSGNSLGATEGLVLLVKQGLMPTLEVDVQAGAFNGQKVAMPSEVIVLNGFGDADDSVFGVLIDRRTLRLHKDYQRVASRENEEGNFMNYYDHLEFTAFGSNNTFVKVYKAS